MMDDERGRVKPRWIRVVTEIIWAAPNGKTNQQTSQRHDVNCWGGKEKNNKNNNKKTTYVCSRGAFYRVTPTGAEVGKARLLQRAIECVRDAIKEYQVGAKSTKTARVNAMKGQSRRGRQKEAGPSLSLSLFFLITNYKFTAFLFVPTHGHNYLWLELAVKPGRVLAR